MCVCCEPPPPAATPHTSPTLPFTDPLHTLSHTPLLLLSHTLPSYASLKYLLILLSHLHSPLSLSSASFSTSLIYHLILLSLPFSPLVLVCLPHAIPSSPLIILVLPSCSSCFFLPCISFVTTLLLPFVLHSHLSCYLFSHSFPYLYFFLSPFLPLRLPLSTSSHPLTSPLPPRHRNPHTLSRSHSRVSRPLL